MHGGSSHTRKGTLSRTHLHQSHPYQPSRPHAARWVRWTPTVAMAPVPRTCGRFKHSYIKRHPRRLPRRVRARRRYPRQKRRVPTVEATRAQTTSRRCALRGVCAAATTVGTRVRMGQQMGRVSIWTTMRTRMAREICAWPARLRIHGSTTATIFSPARSPVCGI